MLMSILPIGVLAEEASAGNKTVVKQENLSVKSAQDVNVSGVKPIAIAEEIQILEYQGFQYQEKPEGLTLISYSGVLNETKILEIPEKINGISVTKIDKELFKNNAELKEVIIPKGLTEIDKTAFDGCTGLEKITVDKENATYYDENGKLYQSDTKQLIIAPANWKESKTDEPVIQTEPATIQKNQSTDKVVDLPQLNTTAVSNSAELVQTNAVLQGYEYVDITGGIRITKYRGSQTDITIPDTLDGKTVLEIGENAFYSNFFITKVTLSSNVLKIGNYAFSGCSLASINLDSRLTTIGNNAFSFCSNLYKINIPESVTNIGNETFSYCNSLSIYGVKGSYAETYAENNTILFIDTSSTSENGFWYADVEGGVEIIKYDGSGVGVTIPSTLGGKDVVSIGEKAFLGQTSITKVILGSNLLSIGSQAFKNCSGIKEITFNSGLTAIGSNAFTGCSGLTTIMFKNSLTTIGSGAFSYCSGLTSLNISDGVTTLGDPSDTRSSGVFYGCSNLKSVIVGKGVTSIPNYMFCGNNKLETILFNGSVTNIGDHAFSGCGFLSICGEKDTYVQMYANQYGIPFINSASASENGFWYSDVDDGVQIIKYDGSGGTVTIPETLNGKKVVSIGEKAFAGQTSIKKVTMSNNLSDIGFQAFASCSELTDITFNSGLTTIESGAFTSCTGLTNLAIPDNVKNLGDPSDTWFNGVFYGCSNLKSVLLGKGITSINSYMFASCSQLNTVTFNGGLTSIGDYAFYYTELSSITLPESLEKIGNNAFSICSSLVKIVIPASINSIGTSAFSYCSCLAIFGTKGSVAEKYAKGNNIPFVDLASQNKSGFVYENMNGGIRILRYVGESTTVVIPTTIDGKKVLEIGSNAFAGQTQITKITLNSGLKTIGSAAFKGCEGLTALVIPDTVTTLGDGNYNLGVFNNCENLESLTLGTGITAIPSYLTSNCYRLDTLVFKGKITSIGNSAFYKCTALTNMAIPDSTTTIGTGAFVYCDQLSNLTFGKSLTSIGNTAFSYCKNLEEVSLPSSLTTINSYDVFRSCEKLSKVTIPETVKAISSNIFSGSSLVTIYGQKGSYSETFANTYGLAFIGSEAPAFRVDTFTTDKAAAQYVNTGIKLTAVGADGKTPYQYKFYYKLGAATVTIKNFSTTNIANFKPTKPGNYNLFVDVKDANGNTATKSIDNYSIVTNPSVKTFTIDKTSGQTTNTGIQLNAVGADGITPYQYKFYYKLGSTMTILQEYSTTATATFKPIAAGTYTLYVDIKDAGGKTATKSITSYKVVNSLGVKSFITDKTSGQGVDTSIKLTATGSDGKTPYQYQFGYKLGSATTMIKDFSTSNTATFKPTMIGIYTLLVTIRDGNGKTVTKNIDSYSIVPNPSVSSFTTDKASGQGINTSIQLKAEGADGKTPYQYKFYYKLGTSTVTIKNFASANTATFKPTKVGDYTLYVDLKDANGKTSTRSIKVYQVVANPAAIVHPTSVGLNKITDALIVGYDVTLSATVLPANASNKAITWASSDTNIAVVDDSGNVTGVSAGITTIIATTVDGSQEASCEITVNQDEQFQSVEYQSFIQNHGWMEPVSNWEMTGTTGMLLRIEAIKINLLKAPEGSHINYEVYDDKTGWQGLLSDGEMAGSLGNHMEAIKITLQNMPGYSVKYDVSVTGLGWMPYAADGEVAGTTDRDLPIEAIRIRIVRN